MGIEVVAIMIDTITALAAVVGVIVATKLGLKAVRVAKETVDRSERDYAASRVDAVGAAYAKVIHAMANVKADLHLFWKGDLEELVQSSPDSPRRQVLEDRNHEAEVEVHRDVYMLESACVGLQKAVDAVSLNYNSEQIPAPMAVDRVAAAIQLYNGSVYPHYLTLLSDDKKNVPAPLKKQAAFIDWFTLQLGLDKADPSSKDLEVRAAEWIKTYLLKGRESQSAAEIIAVNFINSFALKELDAALNAVTEPVMNVCRPMVVDNRMPSNG